MNSDRQIARLLTEEHRGQLDLLGRVEAAMAGRKTDEAVLRELAKALHQQVEHDVGRHFDFEENELFTRMEESGEGDIAGLLADEHAAIRDVAEELLPLAAAAIEGSLDADGWDALRRTALEMVERQVAHIQKEEMALLPLLDDLLDDETDAMLAMEYAS
ncbi:hemerythrin domain-containing protein [Ottowia sp.]|uniref:hemerythrin domain-containing protein n=1 Tax=Ottowia sp. TaxID=1898956 RepID=UPI002BB933E2|nr:hemerythrin domain-containing protein [Ottowia sp.]HRN75035.1 hemerythrin domain-containing protein [Ottowia sp.]HRQ02139.1 hemerythrin domain-containing protein [Ottowia sp.]